MAYLKTSINLVLLSTDDDLVRLLQQGEGHFAYIVGLEDLIRSPEKPLTFATDDPFPISEHTKLSCIWEYPQEDMIRYAYMPDDLQHRKILENAAQIPEITAFFGCAPKQFIVVYSIGLADRSEDVAKLADSISALLRDNDYSVCIVRSREGIDRLLRGSRYYKLFCEYGKPECL